MYAVERRFAEQLESTLEAAEEVNRVNDEESVRRLCSFLSATTFPRSAERHSTTAATGAAVVLRARGQKRVR